MAKKRKQGNKIGLGEKKRRIKMSNNRNDIIITITQCSERTTNCFTIYSEGGYITDSSNGRKMGNEDVIFASNAIYILSQYLAKKAAEHKDE